MYYIIFFLAVAGCSTLIKTLSPDRKPFNCPLCMGFWIALIFMLLEEHLYTDFIIRPLWIVFAGAYTSWVLYSIGNRLEWLTESGE